MIALWSIIFTRISVTSATTVMLALVLQTSINFLDLVFLFDT